MVVRDSKGRFVSNKEGNGKSTNNSGITNNRFEQILRTVSTNATLARQKLIQSALDPRRDIDDEAGYPKHGGIGDYSYRFFYDRHPIARRVVDILPDESWNITPSIFESEDLEEVTEFEQAWNGLARRLRGESWFRDQEGNPIWEHLHRVDRLSGIGHYGILLLGLDDGKDLRKPVDGIDPDTGKSVGNPQERDLLFLRTFDSSLVDVQTWNTNQNSPRFGHPETYNVDFSNPNQNEGGIGVPNKSEQVHWTRVIHIADNLVSSEIFGSPRMQTVWNRLYDLRKIYAADGETYWRNAVLKLFLETNPQLGGEVDVDTAAIENRMEQMMNGLQQWGVLEGLSAKSIAPSVSDPSPHVQVQIEAICVRYGIPKRIFTGSERGELASSQDEKSWNRRLSSRQNGHITPRIVVPFVDRLIQIGVLPRPEGYSVVWPDMNALTEAERATIAKNRTDAMVKYVTGGVEGALMDPIDYLTRELDYTQEEATQILETVTQALGLEEGNEG